LRSIIILVTISTYCFAQENLVDSTYIFEADPIVVTAERYESLKFNSTSAMTVINEQDVALLPINKLTDVLGTAPGMVFMHQDGLGEDPTLNIRGFYGGGEAEYILVLVDGRPLNDFESDHVNWNALPISNIQSMEILKGQSSSLYGNMAIGGVLNIRTKKGESNSTKLSLWGGSYNNYRAELYLGVNNFKIYGSLNKLDGYREHANRQNQTFGSSIQLLKNENHFLQLSLINYWTNFYIPGPLPEPALEQNRRESSAYFKHDQTNERKHKIWIDSDWNLAPKMGINFSLAGEYRKADKTTTLPLSPEFADTKDRVLTTKRVESFAQLFVKDIIVPVQNTLTLGIEGSTGELNSDFSNFFQGGLDDYKTTNAERGDIYAKGDGTRDAIALYLHYELQLIQPLRLTLGGRYDWLSDAYNILPPSQTDQLSTKHAAFSPKLGINYNYLENTSQRGNIYLNISRSFKAPTLDQLYDQRSIPTPFPPYSITLSNALLAPQRGSGGELGLYHSVYLNSNKMIGDISLALYSINMKDEIDFDLQQFKYVNIGKSRHQGFEMGLRLQWLSGITPFINYTNQAATSQYGESKGKYLKAVPRQVITGGLTLTPLTDFAAGLTVRSHKDIYLDDQNTIVLPDYTVTDLKFSYDMQIKAVSTRIFVEILNVFDRIYSTTGFPDPAGTSGLVYYYPAAERYFRLGLMVEI
jgi:outer membrane receptor protein involved in Fe transport